MLPDRPPAAHPLESLVHAVHRAPAQARLRVALASFAFHALRLHEHWAFANPADYVRGRLGIPLARHYDNVSAGRLLASSRRIRSTFLQGRLDFSSLALLGRSISADEIESALPQLEKLTIQELRRWIGSHRDTAIPARDDSAAPDYLNVSLQMPRSAARYCEETLRLARALCGGELPDDEAVGAVLAEASTELEFTPDSTDFARVVRTSRSRRRAAPLSTPRRAEAESAVKLLQLSPENPRRLARQIDRTLRRALRQLDELRFSTEDRLLDAIHERVPERTGYISLRTFFARGLQLAPSTGFEMLRRARQRRRDDPLACSRASGKLSTIAAIYLERLRSLGVPASCMQAWIDEASAVTVRQLHRSIQWAIRRSEQDQLAWASEEYRPPTTREVQASECSLHELLADVEHLPAGALATEPRRPLRVTLRREHAQLLADLMQAPGGGPRWWRLLRLFFLAREAWESNVGLPRNASSRILERDHYRCQAPECSRQRNLEVHHIHYRSHGGDDDEDNLITLCAWHHRQGEHGQHLRVRGKITPDRDQLFWELGRDEQDRALIRYRGERICA